MKPVAASTASAIPPAAGSSRSECGAFAASTSRPISAKVIWAANSAVTSTIVLAVASAAGIPCSVTTRAPSTKPPIAENGNSWAAASRTIRPHVSTHGDVAPSRPRTSTYQAAPSGMNSPAWIAV